MILEIQLLQLYRCKQLVELLDQVAKIFEYEGFPYLSLEWSPVPSNMSTMIFHDDLVWDNYDKGYGDHGLSLTQTMASMMMKALSRDKADTFACQSWRHGHSAPFAVQASAPSDFLLTRLQRYAPESIGEPIWSDFISHSICRERDCALFLTARTCEPISEYMMGVAVKIMTAFGSAYRFLHSQSVVISEKRVGPTRMDLLSRREVECLQWLALGKTLSEAATIMGISERTLRFHVSNARDRLGVSTTMQAVVAAALVYGFDPNDPRHSIYTASRPPITTDKKRAG